VDLARSQGIRSDFRPSPLSQESTTIHDQSIEQSPLLGHWMWRGPKRFRNVGRPVSSGSLKHVPDTQGLRDCPSLGKAPPRRKRGVTVCDLTQTAHAVSMDLIGQRFEEAYGQKSVTVNAKMSERKRAK